MRKNLQTTIAILVVLAVGALLWQVLVRGDVAVSPAPPQDVGPVPVRTEVLVGRELSLELDLYGSLVAQREVDLALEVPGRIAHVFEDWRPGVRVEAGTELVALDPALFELEVEASRAAREEMAAAVASAGVELERSRLILGKAGETLTLRAREYARLVELDAFATDSQRDQALGARLAAEERSEAARAAVQAAEAGKAAARARLQGAEVALRRAEQNLSRSRLAAPFDGVLSGRGPSVGTLVTPGGSLGRLVDPASIVLVASVPEWELPRLHPGMGARIEFPTTPETAPDPPLRGEVLSVGQVSDPVTRRGEAHIGFVEQPQGGADGEALDRIAGRFAHAVVTVETLHDAIWIPRRALRWSGRQALAFVLAVDTDGRQVAALRRPVFLRSHGEGFLVASGLVAGEILLLHPIDRLEDGAPVAAGVEPRSERKRGEGQE